MYSRPATLAKLDGRTTAAQVVRQVKDQLTEHVGGNPTITQRLLIERAAFLVLRVQMLDRKLLAGDPLSMMDGNQGLAWINGLRRTLEALGLEAPAAASQPLDARQYLDALARDRGEAA